jgi:hypothetical protein
MSQVLSKKDREELIDKLLVFMNGEIEQEGAMIGQISFNFNPTGPDTTNFTQRNMIEYEVLKQIIKICKTRGYIKTRYPRSEYGTIALTEEGQGRAISIEVAEHATPIPGSNILIGTLNANGHTQIGDNNTQNIEYIFNSIIDKIDNADASEQDKTEARNLLGKFIAHPLTNTVLGAASAIITAKLGGM